MRKILDIGFIIFNIFAILITIYLLRMNDNKVCTIANYSIISFENDVNYNNVQIKKGTLGIIKKDYAYKSGDEVIYTVNRSNHRETIIDTIKNSSSKAGQKVYKTKSSNQIEDNSINGLSKNLFTIRYVGNIINFLEKDSMYLVFVIIPLGLLFVFQFIFGGSADENEIKNKNVSAKKTLENTKVVKNANNVNNIKNTKNTKNTKNVKKDIHDQNKEIIQNIGNDLKIETEITNDTKDLNYQTNENSFKQLKEIDRQFIKLLKNNNDINDIDINEYYKTR